MIFTPTPLKGAFVIDVEKKTDERGFFARTFCANEFEKFGLKPNIAQSNISFNNKKGTLRGMHYQVAPNCETKLVRCTRGAIYDVIVDLRANSPTYLQHFGIELTAQNCTALYVPEMFAHGYLTLTDHAEVSYQVSEFYAPGAEKGLHYDDPKIAINWPIPIELVSTKDSNWPLL